LLAEHFTLFGQQMLAAYCGLSHPSILPSDDVIPLKWTFALQNLPILQKGLWLAAIYATATTILIQLVSSQRFTKLLVWLVPLVVVIASVVFGRWFVVPFESDRVFKRHPAVEHLSSQSGYGRTLPFGMYDNAFQLGYHGVPSTIGVHGKEPIWYVDFIGGYGRVNAVKARPANLAATRYILCRKDNTPASGQFGPLPLDTIGNYDDLILYENRNAFPRTYLVGKYQVVPDRKQIYPLVLKGKENLRELAYLEEKPELQFDTSEADTCYASIDHCEADSISILVTCCSNKLLILTDNYYPAWQAYVDGVERKIYRAYGTFRAVEIPAGSKSVVFRYHSSTYQLGKWLTMCGLVIVLGVLGFHTIGRIRSRRRNLIGG
jgi:hypothetical protein